MIAIQRTRPALLALVCAFTLAASPAAQQRDLAEGVPANAIGLLTVDDLSSFITLGGTAHLGTFLRRLSTEHPEILEATFPRESELLQDFERKTDLDVSEILLSMDGEAGIVLFSPMFDRANIAVGLLLDTSGPEPNAADLWNGLAAAAMARGDVQRKIDRVDDLDVVRLVTKRAATLTYAIVGSMLVATLEGTHARKLDHFPHLLDAVRGETETLADTRVYADTASAREGSLVHGFLNTPRFVDQLRTDDGFLLPIANLVVVSDVFGITETGSISLSTSAFIERLDSQITFDTPRGNGVQSLFSESMLPGMPPFTDLVDDDALLYSGGRFDGFTFWSGLIKMLLDSEVLTPSSLRAMLLAWDRDLGVDPIDDLLASFDGRFALVVEKVAENWALPDTKRMPSGPISAGVIIGLNDAETVRAAEGAWLRNTGLYALVTRTTDGQRTRSSLSPIGVPFSIFWTITDDMLALSLAPEIIERTLNRADDSAIPSLAELPDVMRVFETPSDITSLTRTSPAYLGMAALSNIETPRSTREGLAEMDATLNALINECFRLPSITITRVVDETIVVEHESH